MGVCDAFDAMTSTRAYRDARAPEVALEEVERESGIQFSPACAEAFLAIPDEIFTSLQAQRPEAIKELPERVQTLRNIDPSVFTTEPLGAG